MALYFHYGPQGSDWTTNPLQQTSSQMLAQFELGSVESRAAARALLAVSREEPLIVFPGDGSVYFHQRCFEPETARELSRVVKQLSDTGQKVASQ
jgi:hypothetical protein